MKKVNIKLASKELDRLNASDSKKTIILNNIELYNDLITAYKQDKEQRNLYIIYQLNGMIIKQMNELEKLSKQNEELSDDTFTAMVDAIKDRKVKPVNGFNNKAKDVETR